MSVGKNWRQTLMKLTVANQQYEHFYLDVKVSMLIEPERCPTPSASGSPLEWISNDPSSGRRGLGSLIN